MRSDIAYIAKHFLHKTFFLFPADDDAFPLDMTAVAFDAVHPAHIYNISLMDPVKTVVFQCFFAVADPAAGYILVLWRYVAQLVLLTFNIQNIRQSYLADTGFGTQRYIMLLLLTEPCYSLVQSLGKHKIIYRLQNIIHGIHPAG